MTHLKRQKVPKSWPIFRKGTSYVVRPNSNLYTGIPLLIVIRDMLKIAQNRKEVKRAINEKKILLNGRNIKSEKNSMVLFDVINIVPSKKDYRLMLNEKGKFAMEETKEPEKKISKVVNKRTLKGKKVQLNLSDGRNILSDKSCSMNSSVLINLKENMVEKCLELKEKASALVVGGKHSGKKGEVIKINAKDKLAEIQIKDNSKINALIKHIMVVE